MARRTLTQEDYELLIDAFREDAPKYRIYTAARTALVDPTTARKAWETGWPEKHWDPIQQVLQKEKRRARALLEENRAIQEIAEEKERDAAITNAATARVQEGTLVALSRSGALKGLEACALILEQAPKLAILIREQVENDCKRDPDDAFKLSANQGLSLLDKMASTMAKIVDLGHKAMVMERLHLGEPGEITGVVVTGELTLREAETRIEAATQAVLRAKESGGLQVLAGGLETPVIGKKVNLV